MAWHLGDETRGRLYLAEALRYASRHMISDEGGDEAAPTQRAMSEAAVDEAVHLRLYRLPDVTNPL